MSKYQFFCKPNTNRKEFTFLNSDSDSFLREKEQLLVQGFEVEDDYIYAETESEAVEKFKSNYLYAIEEYTKSNPVSGIFYQLNQLIGLLFKVFRKNK
ncbi:hypothetical protein [Photobacterium chitinilyticum]|uniref:Uncharacterized protein n=1 Tax=Photobacterium chitinilyticum TaxID=2485123 RepID=A0A444JHY3_9GAMM|nr:hypothetical protein [Photobacterium chitinilyticum]RWX52754.1 hypothetical protein EDI28_25590 [Photobacterium chitinilyticum]